jgi:hypothetical protein
MLAVTAMAAILMAANGPQKAFGSKASTPQQEGPRSGNTECAPSGANPDDARYSCPQNRPIDVPGAPRV